MSVDPAPANPWPRIRRALLARPSRRQLSVAALCGLLAFALVTQVRATATTAGLSAARPADLVGILADLDNRADRLRAQVTDLQASERRLRSGSDAGGAALVEARARARTLGILTGTLPASGPGVVLTIADPRGRVRPDTVVDAIEELRDAGAEAMQLSGVRVVASTWVTSAPGGGLIVDGRRVSAPYRLAAVGTPHTLAGALGITGGVLDTVDAVPGAHAVVLSSPHVTITALQPLRAPRYARPAHR